MVVREGRNGWYHVRELLIKKLLIYFVLVV